MSDIAAPTALRFEHHTGSVLGIGTPTPRLSWQIPAAPSAYRQTRYEVEITRGGRAELFPAASGDQILVPWPGAPLAPRELAAVRVRAGDATTWSDWSAPATVEAGLLTPEDWTARFISPRDTAAIGQPAPILTGTFHLPEDAASARLYATAHGLYVAHLNGIRVGDEQLAPGWTAYEHRLRYQTHDVTALLRPGANVLEFVLGNGWHRGRLGFRGQRALYGDRLAVLAQLEVTTTDGTVHTLATNAGWTARESHITTDDLYDGQTTDLRRLDGTRSRVAHQSGPVDVIEADLGVLVAPDGPPVRVTQVLPAVSVGLSPSGKTIVDFGQNLVGWVRLRVSGRAGDEIVVRHAEVLEHGELGVRPLRTARATDTYILGAAEPVVLEPSLTFHGFRYAEVSGVEALTAADVEAVVIGSDLRRTGWFETDHELLDRFHENVVWGMRGNFVDVPTDCPQRDERLGWTGDIQVFSPTATFLFDTAGFLGSWLADLASEQQKDGSVPFVIPDVIRDPGPATAAWGDAATIVPWVLFQRTGDRALLARQLPSMRAWVDRMSALAGDKLLWTGGFQFGDWLDPTAPPDDPFRAKADPDVIATAHFARSAEVVAQAAAVIGADDIARDYADLAARVRAAFAREYVTPGGRVLSDAPTSYALALQWALLPDSTQRKNAGRRLADLVRAAGFRISTGFVGTPLMTDALTDAGESELAYRLLLQTGCPSWLYPVIMGATTVWERWDSMLPDGSINPGEMTSFNHYALGAVADWLHRRVAGLAPAAPGYRRIEVRPLPTFHLTRAAARHLTPYGEASVEWKRLSEVEPPAASSAEENLAGGAGEKGLAGSAGEEGLAGSAGEGGLAGGAGEEGLAGRAGEGGLAGSAGEEGLAGSAGEGGLAGSAGEEGLAGSAGEGGLAGGAGEEGRAGGAGEEGLAGGAGVEDRAGWAGGDGSTAEVGSGAGRVGRLLLRVTVPVGATATVHVPGAAEPVEVGHGTHEWVTDHAYRKASVLPAEPSIRQLMDHRPSWDRVVAAAVEAGVTAGEAALADRLAPFFDAPATELVNAATAGGFVPGAWELAAKLSTLLSEESR